MDREGGTQQAHGVSVIGAQKREAPHPRQLRTLTVRILYIISISSSGSSASTMHSFKVSDSAVGTEGPVAA